MVQYCIQTCLWFVASSVDHWFSELEISDQILAGAHWSSFVMLSILLNFFKKFIVHFTETLSTVTLICS